MFTKVLSLSWLWLRKHITFLLAYIQGWCHVLGSVSKMKTTWHHFYYNLPLTCRTLNCACQWTIDIQHCYHKIPQHLSSRIWPYNSVKSVEKNWNIEQWVIKCLLNLVTIFNVAWGSWKGTKCSRLLLCNAMYITTTQQYLSCWWNHHHLQIAGG